jgi:hypothetical protein
MPGGLVTSDGYEQHADQLEDLVENLREEVVELRDLMAHG